MRRLDSLAEELKRSGPKVVGCLSDILGIVRLLVGTVSSIGIEKGALFLVFSDGWSDSSGGAWLVGLEAVQSGRSSECDRRKGGGKPRAFQEPARLRGVNHVLSVFGCLVGFVDTFRGGC